MTTQHAPAARRVQAALRDAEAVRLLAAGATYRHIAAQLGYSSPGDVYRAVWRNIRAAQFDRHKARLENLIRRERRTYRRLIAKGWSDDADSEDRWWWLLWVFLLAELNENAPRWRAELRHRRRRTLDQVGRSTAGAARRDAHRRMAPRPPGRTVHLD